jgi:hypothetical protein
MNVGLKIFFPQANGVAGFGGMNFFFKEKSY